MVDRVMRLKDIYNIEQGIDGGVVRIVVEGRVGGKTTRIVMHLDHLDIPTLAEQMKAGVTAQQERWSDAGRGLC